MFIDGKNTVIAGVEKGKGSAKGKCGIMFDLELPFVDVYTLVCLITDEQEKIEINLN